MAQQLISFPFRIGVNGAVATKLDGTDDYYAEELAQLVGTRPGERLMVPTYGMPDPAFDEVSATVLMLQAGKFGPPVRIADVQTRIVNDGDMDVTITFDSAPPTALLNRNGA